MIATPTHTSQNAIATTASLVNACVRLDRMNVKVAFTYVEGEAYIDNARNWFVTQFLASKATDILFLDYDVGFDVDGFLRVVMSRRPFTCGVYPLKTEEESYPVCFDGENVEVDAEGFVHPLVVPNGFWRLNRSVFEVMDHEDYEYGPPGQESRHLGYFRHGPRAGRFIGEDADFCRRWLAVGGEISMVPDVEFTHTGTKTWRGNWARHVGLI